MKALALSLGLTALAACEPPLAPTPVPAPESSARVIVNVLADGSATIDGEAVAKSDIEQRFAALAAAGAEVAFTVDKDADYKSVAEVMKAAQRSKLTKMGVIGGT